MVKEKLIDPCECGNKEVESTYDENDDYEEHPLSMKCTKCGKEHIKTTITVEKKKRTCRVCGCTDDDCSQCIKAQGHPCNWVESDLCSRCKDEGAK